MQNYKNGLVWLRRDYRLDDNHALFKALEQCETVFVCFIFDKLILDKLDHDDQRVPFIIQSVREVNEGLKNKNSKLIIRYGNPVEKIPEIIKTFSINALYFNRDYEPYATKRDRNIHEKVTIPIHAYKDSVIFEKEEVLTKDNGFYRVFTPYKNQWLTKLNHNVTKNYSSPNHNYASIDENSSIEEDRWFDLMGFTNKNCFLPGGRTHALKQLKQFKTLIAGYDVDRDFPGLDKTSSISPYIRFGCISIRELVRFSLNHESTGSDIWLSELIWRDFYQMIVSTHPNCHTESIKPIYDTIEWQGKDEWFDTWCNGQTGYPIVDAAMRQLNTTGLMHNRCRMIVASFLCKTLLINWRKGEAYFAKKLLDFDFASNNGGWGWASSTGCDAQPYFRIFNPYSQSEKFDSKGNYIRQYCPELNHLNNKDIHNPQSVNGYPKPIVDYKEMRIRALDMYSVVKR